MRAAIFMLGVLLLPLAAPGAVAWRADGWLTQEVVGGERLTLGDEFGCHGMPGKNVADNRSVISECKMYLTSQINASKWGAEPLSFGLQETDSDSPTRDLLMAEGFRIVGDQIPSITGQNPNWAIERSGGSLEQNVASISAIEQGIESNGYANLYWEAQIEDLNVRRDKDVLTWIESQDYWFTTWGEWFSSTHPASEFERTNQSITLKGTATSNGGWGVPGNTFLSITGGQITDISRIDGGVLDELTIEDNHLKEGFRILDQSNATLTIPEGALVLITWAGDIAEVQIEQGTFNNFTPFMAVGHHTTDLFEWSSPFQDSPLRFTWLIEPQPDIEPTWILPMLAVLIILVAPVAIRYTLNHDREMHYSPEEE
ncbi:MAG: hypothetical protein OSB33_04760 [Candidatus Poseidoniales archaeon]|nr:hypothetical protein [Candidatus Poseidoniales archaeon]